MTAPTLLNEYYESGNAPHEALGRAARRLSNGGAIYLGGGVGVEKQGTPKGDTFHVTKGDGGKSESFSGPLSAVIRAFTVAGSATTPDSPGGTTVVSDPAAAARLRELKDEEASAQDDIRRYEVRLARRVRQQQLGKGLPWAPGIDSDDRWEQRRIEELKADLSRIATERARLLAGGAVEEAEAGKPGTNWKQVGPKANAQLAGLKAHYAKQAHPFTACVRDNTKRFGPERAKRVCAVLKDLIEKRTTWRKGGKGKVSEEVERLLAAAVGRLAVVEEAFGLAALVQLAEGVDVPVPQVAQLAEGIGDDFALLAMAGHPLALAVFGIEEGYDDALHPRDFLGRWKKKVAGLKPGESASLPDGVSVKRVGSTYEVHARGHAGDVGARSAATRQEKAGQVAKRGSSSSAENAATLAAQASAQSDHPASLGGATKFRSLKAYTEGDPKPRTAKQAQRFNSANRRAQEVAADRHKRLERQRREGEASKPTAPGTGAERGSGDTHAAAEKDILGVLPGANVRKTKRGLEVGGFSMPPVEAQRKLRAAGLNVEDVFGATVVKVSAPKGAKRRR